MKNNRTEVTGNKQNKGTVLAVSLRSAEVFMDIRRLRNDIAHEYIPSAIEEIFKKTLKLTPDLIDSVEKIKEYGKDKI